MARDEHGPSDLLDLTTRPTSGVPPVPGRHGLSAFARVPAGAGPVPLRIERG